MTPLSVIASLPNVRTLGSGEGLRPLDRHAEIRRHARTGLPGRSLGRPGSSGGPGSGNAQSPTAVKSLRDSSAHATVLRMTAAADRAGSRLRASPKAGPVPARPVATACAAPLSRRTGPESASAAGPMPVKHPPAGAPDHRASTKSAVG